MTAPLLRSAAARLQAAGLDSPRVEAEVLLAALLAVPRARLVTAAEPPASVAAEYERWLSRRVAREPLQHITGSAPFRHLDLAVGPGVFVPRPETELLVDAVLPHLRSRVSPLVVDLCAGSGALGLAVADEVPGATVIAVEYAGAALRWLARNAAGTRVRVVAADVRDPELLRAEHGTVDAVLANPPYVPVPTQVAPEVLADPHDAVFAGTDGLDLIPVVIARAALLVVPGGVLAMEHDDTQTDAVSQLLAEDGRWTAVHAQRDLTGRPRYVTATRR